MADKDLGDGDGPSLEMPSLGSLFKRKKKPVEQDDTPTVSREELDAVVRGKKPSRDTEPEAGPGSDDPAPGTPSADDAATGPDEVTPGTSADDDTPTTVVPRVDGETDAEPTTVLPDLDADADASATRSAAPDEAALAETTAPSAQPASADRTDVSDEPASDESTPTDPDVADPAAARTPVVGAGARELADDDGERPLFADEADTDESGTADADEADADEVDAETGDIDDDAVARPPRERRNFTLPPLPGRAAAAITGLVVGLLAVAMTYLAVQGCEKVKGTSSCGTPGFFLLIAIMILLVVLGSSLLNAWKLADPGSTSFMAVGLVAVVALLFLIRVIFSPWMVVVIPLVAIVAFVVSHWLTSLFIDEDSPIAEDESADASA